MYKLIAIIDGDYLDMNPNNDWFSEAVMDWMLEFCEMANSTANTKNDKQEYIIATVEME